MLMSDKELWETGWQLISGLGIGFWCGLAVAVATYAFEISLKKRGLIFSGRDKKFEQAKKAGHMIKAQLVYVSWKDKGPAKNKRSAKSRSARRRYRAKYQYIRDGEVKTEYVSMSMYPPRTITLYYFTDPNKLFAECELGGNPLEVLVFIIPLVAGILVAMALGYKG